MKHFTRTCIAIVPWACLMIVASLTGAASTICCDLARWLEKWTGDA